MSHGPGRLKRVAEWAVSACGDDDWYAGGHVSSRSFRVSAGAAGLFLALLGVWQYGGGDFLLQRSLWMDEVHTWLLVSDPDAGHAMRALADGVDFNPPGYFLVARMAGWLPGELTEYRLRLFSLGCTIAALLAVYLLLCRRTSPLVSATAVLCMSGQAVLIQQVTEIRFYALWLAAVAWLCWLLDRRQQRESLWQMPPILALAALICTCHYFGIFSLALVLCGCSVVRRDRRSLRCHAAVLLTGLASLALCWRFLSGQRAALTRPTWITPPAAGDSLEYLLAAAPLGAVAVLLAGVSAAAAVARLDRRCVFHALSRSLRTPGAGLTGMGAVLVAFSWLIQPALVLRYAVTGVIGFAPLLAALISLLSPGGRILCFLAGLVIGARGLEQSVSQWEEQETQRDRLAAAAMQLPTQSVVLFEDRIMWLPLVYGHPQLLARCSLADFDDSEMVVDSDLRAVQRDVGRRISKWYPQYQTRTLASLHPGEEFFVVPYRGGGFRDLRYPTGCGAVEYVPGIYWFSYRNNVVNTLREATPKGEAAKTASRTRKIAENLFDYQSR